MSIKEKEKQLKVKRAEMAMLELEFKIEKAKEDIKRMEDHIELQMKVIKELKEKL